LVFYESSILGGHKGSHTKRNGVYGVKLDRALPSTPFFPLESKRIRETILQVTKIRNHNYRAAK
jgi:hypothetical protein